MKHEYKYVFFDLDGTLTDPKVGITKAVAYALKHFGIEVTDLDTLCKFIGPPLKESFMVYYGFTEKQALAALEKYREYFSATGIYENKVYAGMEALLQRLTESGRILVVATSKPRVFAERILAHFNLSQYFTDLVGSELDGTRVKKGDVIAYALERNNIKELREVVMVGDREHDIIGAKENNMDSLGILYGYGDRKEHELAGADYIAETVDQLSEFLL